MASTKEQSADATSTLLNVLNRSGGVRGRFIFAVAISTAGSLLASRLSEDDNTTVLVLEAGQLHDKDPLIDKPNKYLGQLFQPSYDWGFKTVSLINLSGSETGKGLGGSSNINFMQWTRPTKVDIDAWQRLGNPGWTWDNLLSYFKKSENKKEHDRLTRVLVYLPSIILYFGGNNFGTVTPIYSIDPKTRTRASSYTSFLRPHLSRPNLTILTGATVTRLITRENAHPKDESLTAEAVEFICEGQTHRIDISREVILCAGTLKSPQILELSGIGNPEILSKAGIEVKLPLIGVGENLQDHTFIYGVCFEIKDDVAQKIPYEIKQPDHLAYFHSSSLAWVPFQTFTNKTGEETISQLLPQLTPESKKSSAQKTNITTDDTLKCSIKEQYIVLSDILSNPNLPDCEFLTSCRFGGFPNGPKPGKSYLTFSVGGMYPWSRGSVHTKSKDPLEHLEIDPNYLEKDIDLELLLQGVKFLRNFQNNPIFKDIINEEINPGPTVNTDEDLRDATGTLSMLPREKGGVVDPALKVWGTNNVRVVDLSIVPLTVSVHTQSTAYVIAEVAADIIRGKISRWY
ncbi:hypothetical protein Clacol_005898 [Clathrus columnatus]|uniref:Glucose-methanol-choline oxidoreductase N-terminal domain-containing protein n=1 Tax=Clathrus columnatus TaxID=1419009 RepID=A0AAV5AD88_9AGAM|nr:hypothetical protein Clacol_005898 [Clathrus columnatus]